MVDGCAGEVSTRNTPRSANTPSNTVTPPATTCTVSQSGVVNPGTSVKQTEWEPGVTLTQSSAHELAVLPSRSICELTAPPPEDEEVTLNMPKLSGPGTPAAWSNSPTTSVVAPATTV